MPAEHRVTLLLNGAELLTIQATPADLEDWATGFLYSEGLIRSCADLLELNADPGAARAQATVDPASLPPEGLAATRYLTSGCGKGVTFSSVKDAMLLAPVRHGLQVDPGSLLTWMRRMQQNAPQYAESGGMHAAAAVRVPAGEMLIREDIGRHNAMDKAIGAALKAGWPPEETVFLTTGRISYEMCAKLARFGAGVGASLTAATDQAIRLAGRLGIDLLGYVRKPEKMVLYTEGSRLC
jgi:FdhD protein